MDYPNCETLGKKLRKSKGLRKKDPSARPYEPSAVLLEYIDDLVARGLKFEGCELAEFYTKNGLPYPGLRATKPLHSNQIFIRVPRHLLLNTRNAFFSGVRRVFEENAEVFHWNYHGDWEDRVLLVFLLFQYQRGRQSPWYLLIQNLPREIDYLSFWEEKELAGLHDQHLRKYGLHCRQQFEKEYKEIRGVLEKYPGLFSQETISYENARWVQIHLNSRCFGKYFAYVTMVPFAELINHECSDVYYEFEYLAGNPHEEASDFAEPVVLSQYDQDNNDTSDGSYYSDGDEVGDFLEQQPLQPPQPEKDAELAQLKDDIRFYVDSFLDFNDSVSYRFIDRVYKCMETGSPSKVAGLLQQCKVFYREIRLFYVGVKGSSFKYDESTIQKKKRQKEEEGGLVCKFKAEEAWQTDKFDNFILKCSSKDEFQPGSQIYYCYGRLSNRALLLRYGFALEFNKYNHYWLHVDYLQEDLHPLLRSQLHHYGCQSLKKIKVKRTRLCSELILWARLGLWNPADEVVQPLFDPSPSNLVEVAVARICIQKLGEELKSLPSAELLESQLKDKRLGYHQYFATVYCLQNVRLLSHQLQLMRCVQTIACRLEEGVGFQKAVGRCDHEREDMAVTNRIMMKNYLQKLRKRRGA